MGTPAVTTRGFSVSDCQELAAMICDVLDNIGNAEVEQRAKQAALELCGKHPVYSE
jgi:glycine hydroxymethyltransferase